MTREMTFRPLSQTSSPSTRTPHSPGISLWQTRLGIPGKPLFSIGGSANWTSRFGAPPPDVASRLRTTSKPQIRSLRVFIASMFTSPLGVFLRSCESSFPEKNLILGIWTPSMPGPTSGFALSGVSPETDWRQKLDHGCQGLGSWSTYMEP